MLLAAALAHHIDLTASWMIGDSDVDMQAGKNAGCRTARILSNNEGATQPSDILGTSLLETVDKLLKWGVPATDPSKRLSHGLASQKAEA